MLATHIIIIINPVSHTGDYLETLLKAFSDQFKFTHLPKDPRWVQFWKA